MKKIFTNYKSELSSFTSIFDSSTIGLGNPWESLALFSEMLNIRIRKLNHMNTENMNKKNKDKGMHLEVLLYKVLKKLEGRENSSRPEYYRNKDLKKLFGLSSNTIIKYRENGTLPFTSIGDIYLYPATEIEKTLNNNNSTIKY